MTWREQPLCQTKEQKKSEEESGIDSANIIEKWLQKQTDWLINADTANPELSSTATVALALVRPV